MSVEGASDMPLAVYKAGYSATEFLDSVKTDIHGTFSYAVNVEKGKPEFLYVYHADIPLASLLLSRGEKAVVSADTLGNYSVSGSEESALLSGINKDFNDFARNLSSAASSAQASKLYVNYYRGRVSYVLSHPYSLTVIPVLYQKLGSDFQIFNQSTDAILFRRAVDSLKTVYPQSPYVKGLETETIRREKEMQLNMALQNAKVSGFPDIVLPDVYGQKKALSGVDSKLVLLNFWTIDEPEQILYNLEVLMPLYKLYRDRGLEIYSVCLSADKAGWASVVRNQSLQWINVCDANAANSTLVQLYNLKKLPTTLVISGGELTSDKAGSASELQAAIMKRLK